MRRFLVLLTACGLLFAAAACGDDDGDIAVTGVTPTPTTEAADDGAGSEAPGDETADETTESDSEETAAGLPSADDLCTSTSAALESVYGTADATDPGDGSYPSCEVEFADATVVVSAYALDDPLVGGDFDAYIEAVGETVDGLEPLEGVGDHAVANGSGQAYALVGETVVSVSRAGADEDVDQPDLSDVVAAVVESFA